jgi:hypothetical protein
MSIILFKCDVIVSPRPNDLTPFWDVYQFSFVAELHLQQLNIPQFVSRTSFLFNAQSKVHFQTPGFRTVTLIECLLVNIWLSQPI